MKMQDEYEYSEPYQLITGHWITLLFTRKDGYYGHLVSKEDEGNAKVIKDQVMKESSLIDQTIEDWFEMIDTDPNNKSDNPRS